MTEVLATESRFFEKNQNAMREQYPGKTLIIVGERVLGAYDTWEDAVRAAVKVFPGDEHFLVRDVDWTDDVISVPSMFNCGEPVCFGS